MASLLPTGHGRAKYYDPLIISLFSKGHGPPDIARRINLDHQLQGEEELTTKIVNDRIRYLKKKKIIDKNPRRPPENNLATMEDQPRRGRARKPTAKGAAYKRGVKRRAVGSAIDEPSAPPAPACK